MAQSEIPHDPLGAFCRDNHMPILVFNLNKPGNILKAVMGEKVGTFVDSGGDSADV